MRLITGLLLVMGYSVDQALSGEEVENSQVELLPMLHKFNYLFCVRNGDANNFVDNHKIGLVTNTNRFVCLLPFSYFFLTTF